MTTLVGEEGERVTRALVGHALGLTRFASLGDAASHAEDGTLQLRVDAATFDALAIARPE